MIVLDTDHVTVLRYPEDGHHTNLTERMLVSDDFALTIVTAEEQLRGWLAEIRRAKRLDEQVRAYERLALVIEFLADWTILRFDDAAAVEFEGLRREQVRIGTQDLRIAAIALANNATLLSANLRDFRKVSGLRVENWLQ